MEIEKSFHLTIMIKFLILFFFSLNVFAQNDNLEKFLSNLNSFEANFVQEVKDFSNQIIDESSGKVIFLKPNFFRWTYQVPSENEIISDGEFLYLYDPDLKQVIESRLDGQLNMSPAMLLVSENIHEFFNTRLLNNSQNIMEFVAQPKNDESAFFKQVIFIFNNNQLNIMKVLDNFDNLTTIKFHKIIQNKDINEAKFLFNYPDDIDVIKN
tara:strand:+ start:1781 stop:2413 length:633 start_codon:yes stop_codon:yes gene_type:complete